MRAILFTLGLLIFAPHAFGAPVFGRYVGVMKHDGIQRDQLAKLELIASREEGNIVHLKGILTLHFGDFRTLNCLVEPDGLNCKGCTLLKRVSKETEGVRAMSHRQLLRFLHRTNRHRAG